MSHSRQIIDELPYAHFITFSVYRRRRLLELDRPKRMLLGVLGEQVRIFDARCVGFVIMPDHVHAIVWLPRPAQLSKFMHAWRRQSSFHIRDWYRQHAPQYFEECGFGERFWQPKYYPFAIYSREKLDEKLVYMHQNPVRAGLVTRASDWPWSSARWYEHRQPVGIPIHWID